MKLLRYLLAMLLFPVLMLARTALADVVVVVDARFPVQHLSKDDVINIFMGRYRRFPNGEIAFPFDQPKGSGARSEFYRLLVDKSPSEIGAYWARLHFSGVAHPPVPAEDPADMQVYLLRTWGGIGYVERTRVDPRLRIVLPLAP